MFELLPPSALLHTTIFNQIAEYIKTAKASNQPTDEKFLTALNDFEASIIHIARKEYTIGEKILSKLNKLIGYSLRDIKKFSKYLIAAFGDSSKEKTELLGHFFQVLPSENNLMPTATYTPCQDAFRQQHTENTSQEPAGINLINKFNAKFKLLSSQDNASIILNELYQVRHEPNILDSLTKKLVNKTGLGRPTILNYYTKLQEIEFIVKARGDLILTNQGEKWCEQNANRINEIDHHNGRLRTFRI